MTTLLRDFTINQRTSFNCGGYALDTYDWYAPKTYMGRGSIERNVKSMLNEFNGRLRLIDNEKDAKPYERVILYRETTKNWDDFHFMYKGKNGIYYHKRGMTRHIDKATKEYAYSACWHEKDSLTYYDSEIYVMALDMRKEEKYIYFDMDGTLFDLYGVYDWLKDLRTYNPNPYRKALPLLDMRVLNSLCEKLQEQGYKIGIISWLAKNSNKSYDKAVREVKKECLAKHFTVNLDHVHIVKYGTNKASLGRGGILFDDEQKNCERWQKRGYKAVNCGGNPQVIIDTLQSLINC